MEKGYVVRYCTFFYIGMIKEIGKVNTSMGRTKKGSNIEIGSRLRIIRENLGKSQAEFAEILDISDEHYRKLESGSTGLTIEKVRILYEKLNIDPAYLLCGKQPEEFDLDKYLVNCSKEQRDKLLRRCLDYIAGYIAR